MLIAIEEKDAIKYRCEVCGENATWVDDGFAGKTANDRTLQIGTNKGIVYAKCDECGKIVCGHPSTRKHYARLQVNRLSLRDKYKNSKCCLQEKVWIDSMGNERIAQCCRDEKCVRQMSDSATMERKLRTQTGG